MTKVDKMVRTDAQWQELLTPEQYYVLRRQGTELPFTHLHDKNYGAGVYCCVGCGTPLFDALAKYDSCTGWPSFYETISPDVLSIFGDYKLPLERQEVRCSCCDGHLGHVFPDGPPPTGLRYCINGSVLKFVAK